MAAIGRISESSLPKSTAISAVIPDTSEIIPFAANQTDKTEKRVIRTQVPVGGHGGGDYGLLEDFFRILREPGQGSRSSIGRSIESHILSCAAEESRLTHTVIDLDDYKARLEARL